MFCRKCGTQNDEEARFCWKCGEPLPNDVTAGETGGSVEQEEGSGWEDGFSQRPAGGQGPVPGQGSRYSQGGPTGQPDENSQGAAPGQGGRYSQGAAPGKGGRYSQGAAPGQGGRYSQGGPPGQRGGNGYGPAPGQRNRYDQGPAQGRRDRFEPEAGARAEDEEKARIRKRLIAAICTVGVLLLICIGTGAFFLINGNSAQAEKKFQEKIVSGNKYVDELDYDSAIDAYQNAIEIEPKKTEGYEKLADVYMQQKEYEKAEETLIKGIQTIKGSTVLQGKLDEVYEYIEPSDPELVLPTEAPSTETQAQAEQQQVTQEAQTEEKAQQGTEGTPVAGETQQGTDHPQTADQTQQDTEHPQTADETQPGTDQPQTADETQQGTDASETTAETQTEVRGSEYESESETAAAETGSEAAGEEPVQVTLTEDEMRAAYQKFIEDSLASGIKLANTDEISYIWGGNAVPPVDEYGGLVSAYVSDLDGDGILEMLTVSYTKTENGLGDKMPGTVVELYAIENGAVADKGIVCRSLEAGSLNRFEEIVKVFVKDVSGKKYICFYGSAMATMLANGPQLTYSIWTYENKEIKNECDFNFFYNRSDFPADVKEKLDSLGLAQGVSEILAGEDLVMITELHALAEGTDQAGAEVPAYAQFTDYTDLKKMLGQPQDEGQTEPESSAEVNPEAPTGEGQTEPESSMEVNTEALTGEGPAESELSTEANAEVPTGEGQNNTEAVSETAAGTEEGSADIAADGETQAETEQLQAEAPLPEPDITVHESVEFKEVQEYNGTVYAVFSDVPDGWVSTGGENMGSYLDKLAVYNDYIYVIRMFGTGSANGTLERCRLDGSETVALVENIYGWGRVWIMDGWLYYATSTDTEVNSGLMRMNLADTSVIEQLPGKADNLVTDGISLYYNLSWESSIGSKCRPDGSEIQDLSFPLPLGAVCVDGRFYYYDSQTASSMNTDGTDNKIQVSGQQLTSMKIYEGIIYYADAEQFYRKAVDSAEEGAQLTQLPEGLHGKDVLIKTGDSIYVRCYMDDTYKQAHPEIPDQLFNMVMCRIPAAGGEAEAVGYWFQS